MFTEVVGQEHAK